MPLRSLLDPIFLQQMIALALSIFNLVAFLWLACTVWLNGNRTSLIARVGVVGLGMAALFFFIHALLIANPISRSSALISANTLWHIIWFPALCVPYMWFVIGLHYASMLNERWRRRRPVLLIISALLGCSVLLFLFVYRSTFTFAGTLRFLANGEGFNTTRLDWLSPFLLLPILFLCYVTFCAIGPWFTPDRGGGLLRVLWYAMGGGPRRSASLRQRLVDAFWDDQEEVDLLVEPVLSWHLARPKLLLSALLMVGLTTSLGILGVYSMLKWFHFQHTTPVPAFITPSSFLLQGIPPNLVSLDIYATGSVALMVLLLGYCVVRHGILIERPLARRGFFEQWRGIVIVATTAAIFIALLVAFTGSSLGGLLLITSIATGIYALFTWSSYTAHDRYVALLRPFLRRTNLRHWLNVDLTRTEQGMEDLFSHLCQDVLEVQFACLIVHSGPVRRSFNYHWPTTEISHEKAWGMNELEREAAQRRQKMLTPRPSITGTAPSLNVNAYRIRIPIHEQPAICWVVPIYDELGLVAKLYLGPRQDGGVFTDEDMDLAHACGLRILDTLRDHEAMLAVAALLRRRIVDVKLLGGQQRRVLHDEILPQMHMALLRLETLRPILQEEPEHLPIPAGTTMYPSLPQRISTTSAALDEAVHNISDAHRRLAAMMRATTTSAPHRLERDGMMHAIHTMLEHDFKHAFDEVMWDVPEETARHIDEMMPPAIAELIFAAVQEALRNAARHARGSDVHRHLCLTLKASCNPHLEVIVMDDGIGIDSTTTSSTTGTGSGLLTHSALLAIAGGSLTVSSSPGEGVTVRIVLPAEALR